MMQRSVVLLAAVVACSDVAGPEGLGMRLEVTLPRHALARGEQGAVVWRVRNLTADTLSFHFASSCQVVLHIEALSNGWRHVEPGACLDVQSRLALQPFAEQSGHLELRAGQAARTGLPLDPGRYRVFATLSDASGTLALRSTSVWLDVR